ncbi:MAG: PaaI family thioesterase, partial [Methyloligellaceae bacterium]
SSQGTIRDLETRSMTMDSLAQLNDEILPFAAHLGIRFVAAEPDRVVAELSIRDELCTRPAVAHGGVLMAFADTLGAAGTILNLSDNSYTTTIESKTNFLAAAPVGSVIKGEATPVHRGRTTMVWQTRVTTESGRLAALVTQTQLVLPARE